MLENLIERFFGDAYWFWGIRRCMKTKRNCWSSLGFFFEGGDSCRLFGILLRYLPFPSSPRVNIDHDWSKCLNTLSLALLWLCFSLCVSLPTSFLSIWLRCLSVCPSAFAFWQRVCPFYFCNRGRISWSYFRFSYLARRRSSLKELWHVNKNPPNRWTTQPPNHPTTRSFCRRPKKMCDNITSINTT